MKIANVVQVLPGKSGLYETTRECVCALRDRGHDARMVLSKDSSLAACPPITLPASIVVSGTESNGEPYMDRGAPVAPDTWLAESDVIMSHSGLSSEHLAVSDGTPIIQLLHGAPDYGFRMESLGGMRAYSSMQRVARGPYADQWRAFVTFWAEHLPYWQVILPADKLHVVPACVDLEAWEPGQVSDDYDWGGTPGKVNVVCTSSWRAGNVDILDVVTAFYHFAKDYGRGQAKLHIYGNEVATPGDAWTVLAESLREREMLGEMAGWVSMHRLKKIYRAAKMMITPHCVASRGVREALAMGCPVVAGLGCSAATQCADIRNPISFARAMKRALTAKTWVERDRAEKLFSPIKTAKGLLAIAEQVVMQEVC